MKQKYKALIIDLDGTAIAQEENALPTTRVIKAIKAAKQVMHACAATGRPITNSRNILKKLGLTSPCIISGGSQIVDPKTEKVLWQKTLNRNQVSKIIKACIGTNHQILFSDELLSDTGVEMRPDNKETGSDQNAVYIMELDNNEVSGLISKLRNVSEIAIHPVPSWKNGRIDVHITHSLATKRHALETLLNMIGVDKSNVVSVGDSGNDIPLFEVSSLKVAMGNATEELKRRADLVIPPVNEDGLAQFIETKIIGYED